MPRLDRLSELSRKSLLTHNVLIHDDAPWTTLSKPLSACKVALVTTAGLHLRGDRPFTGGEQGYRVIPSDAPARDVVLSHTSIGCKRWCETASSAE
jgi:D-proline reductase (dithiol) PrdB